MKKIYVLGVITTAVFEELAFCLFVFKLIYEKYNFLVGSIITSLLFAFIHIGSNLSIICYLNLCKRKKLSI